MSNSFHLAIPAGDLEKAETFYTKILGAKPATEKGKRVDVDFGVPPNSFTSNIHETSRTT